MRVAPAPGRRVPATLAFLLFLLLIPGVAVAAEATPQPITEPGESAGSSPTRDSPRIVEFVTFPPGQCDAGGVVRGIIGIQHPESQPVRVRLALTAIVRATGHEIEVDSRTLPAAGLVEFDLEGDFSGELTGFLVRVRLLDASNDTLQSRFNPIQLPCAETEPGDIVNLPVTGTGSGPARPIAVGLATLAATIILGAAGMRFTRTRPHR